MTGAILAGLVLGSAALILAGLRRPEPKRVPVETDRRKPRRR
jgi:hypothetical protein